VIKRFLLHETIKRYQEILKEDISEEERKFAVSEVASMRRDLALLDASLLGGQRYPNQIGRPSLAHRRLFQRLIEDATEPMLVIDPRPGLHIVDMTPSLETATLTKRDRAVGNGLFQVFPDNPDIPGADGVSNVFNALRAAAETGVPQTLELQRYDVRDAEGQFVERYWRSQYIPILDERGDLVWLLSRLNDLTVQHRG
jgi:hypothetical protein